MSASHQARPILTDGVIELRPLVLADAEAHLAGEDHDWAHWLGGGVSTIDNVRDAIGRWSESWVSAGPVRNFGVWDANTGQLVGNVELNFSDTLSGIVAGESNISYGVFSFARRRGIASRAIELATEYARQALPNISALVIRVEPENLASVAVARKIGFVEDGEGICDNGQRMLRFVRSLAT